MAHPCGCEHDSPATPGRALSPVEPEHTVEHIVRHHAGAFEILKRAGINHCCGAHLSLREAAAAAGAPLGALLVALNPPAPIENRLIVLDVRGLEPPQPMVRVLETLERLRAGAEIEVRLDRRPVFLYPQLEARGFSHETSEPEPGLVRVLIRRRST
jgi:tRNA 2-thiouridine synthesizing protein A